MPALKDLRIKALNFDKNKDYNIDWYNGETKKSEVLGSFRVDTDAQKLTAKLNKNGASKYAITDGFFRLKFRAEETLEVTPGEKGTTGINIEKPNNPGGNKPVGKDKLNPGQGFHKGGYTTNRNGQRVIRWDIGVNADQLKKYLETGKTDDEKQNVWVEDDLPDAGMEVIDCLIVPDEKSEIVKKLLHFSDQRQADLIFTTGGTGFSKRDVTPEATKQVVEREVPGIGEALRSYSMTITPKAMLSRQTAGIRGNTLIINLPGSPKACRENIEYIIKPLKHGLGILSGRESD